MATDPPGKASPTTASMHLYGASAPPEARGTSAGLVLLYSPSWLDFPPAYLLRDRQVVIGRDASAGICIPEKAASRQHARLSWRDSQWILTDLGGKNGTLVDGEFVEEIALEDLHEIRIGDAIFKFVQAGAESYARYRLDGARLPVPGKPEQADAARDRRARLIGGHQVDRLAGAIERVAKSELSVILLGESGTGKELFAEHLHAQSGRKGPLHAINCAAIPATLLESELFGYKRGAFSGADRDKPGILRSADGGTLLLDEIGDMPLEAQAKLLRVLQSKEVIPLGATSPERVDVRIVCATHRDLGRLRTEGRFRGDLFARLNEYSLTLPALRERKEDIYALCRGLLSRHGRPDLGLTFPFLTGLIHYDFPFNVRELEACIKRGIALCDGPALDAPQLPDEIGELMKTYAQRGRPAAAQRAAAPAAGRAVPPTEGELRELLAAHHGNVAAVGRLFGKERMQVHRWLRRYGIDVDEYR